VVELPAVDIVKEEDAATDAVADVEPPKMMMASRPSFKWSTPTGARIGCHQNYPGDVKSMALEQVNLLPRRWLWRRRLASPRPSPKIRLSPSHRNGQRPAGAEQQPGAEGSGRREQSSSTCTARRAAGGSSSPARRGAAIGSSSLAPRGSRDLLGRPVTAWWR